MAYEALLDVLPGSDGVRVTALPDGSVDRFFRVRAGEGYLDSREAFGRRVASGAESFRTDHRLTEPGGQAVNMAQQAATLGDDVTLCGHLDHAVFGPLSVETISMGKPAIVSVLGFADGDLMLSEESDDLLAWTLDDLIAVADLPTLFDTDAVCWGNWVSLPDTTDALERLTDHVGSPGCPFVVDPGKVIDSGDDALLELLDVLGGLTDDFAVTVSVDRAEAERLAAAVDASASDDPARLEAVRAHADLAGVVLHEAPQACVATKEGYEAVENFDAARVERTAGAGDRFTAGLAHALAHDWDWDVALGLGNACASSYVETGETSDRGELVEYVRARR